MNSLSRVARKAAVLTVSDGVSQGVREDRSGDLLAELLVAEGYEVVRRVVPDEREEIAAALRELAGEARVVLTTGGTGVAPRDVTPEATRAIIDREAPGLAEAMRAASLKVTPHAMLSRAVCGIRGRTLIVNLPGSPKACLENLETIAPALPHAMQLLGEDPAAEAGHGNGHALSIPPMVNRHTGTT